MARPQHPRGTKVAVYLRRSGDKQEESLATQRDSAERYCAEKGWLTVKWFVDDSISRAEFVKRPGLINLLAEAKKPKSREFDVLVLRDETRLGGDQIRTGLVMSDLIEAGVPIVQYLDDTEVEFNTPTARFLVTAKNFASELEREKITTRVSEALNKRFREGKVTTQRAYGYKITESKFTVCEAEAVVVRRIFTMYADGTGYRSIATTLNADGVKPPMKSGKRSAQLWAVSTIRTLLKNERYLGTDIYGRVGRVYRGGTLRRLKRPAEEQLRVEHPVIVGAALWQRVQKRLAANPSFKQAKPTGGASTRSLLVGFTRCSDCGGPVYLRDKAWNLKSGQKRRIRYYTCGTRIRQGNSACTNTVTVHDSKLDPAVLEQLRAMITPALFEKIANQLRDTLIETLKQAPDQRTGLEADAVQLRKELGRLAAALALTDQAEPVVEAIKERNTRLRAIEQQLAVAPASIAAVLTSLEAVSEQARLQFANMANASFGDPAEARGMLRALDAKFELSSTGLDGSIGMTKLFTSHTVASTARFAEQCDHAMLQLLLEQHGSRVELPALRVGG